MLTLILRFFRIKLHCLGPTRFPQTFTPFIKSCISTAVEAIHARLKMAPLLFGGGEGIRPNNTYCANFLVAILAAAVIDGRSREDMC